MNNKNLIKIIDNNLFSFLKNKKKESIMLDPALEVFGDILITYLKGGGKHIRSLLFLKAYASKDNIKKNSNIENVAGIFELFQAFALIHDDIIDKETFRRGNKTIHEQYGIPTAILVGNIALMYSDEILQYFLKMNQTINGGAVLELYQAYKQEVMLGQYLDSQHVGSIKTIVHLKTAQYTFVKPVKMGLLIAEEKSDVITLWEEILERVGEVFQLKDDYKNLFYSSKDQGKDRLSDIKEGKKTQFVELFLARANKKDTEKFLSFYNKIILDEEEKKWIIEKMIKLNIKMDLEKQINTVCDSVLKNIKNKFHTNELSTYLEEIITSIKI